MINRLYNKIEEERSQNGKHGELLAAMYIKNQTSMGEEILKKMAGSIVNLI